MLSLRKWRPGHLLASWAAYWAGLAGVTLGPLALRAYRISQLPEGHHATISVGFNNGLLRYTDALPGANTFVSSMPFTEAVMWVVGPPLALWILWLAVRSRDGASRSALGGRGAPDQLASGTPPAAEWRPARGERVGVDDSR